MIDIVVSAVRAMLGLIGTLASVDPLISGSSVTVVVVALAVALLVAAVIAATVHAGQGGSPPHPTRRAELTAPLTQSDPDAPGHIRRRGPSQVTAAA